MKLTLILSAIALASLAGNAYWLNQTRLNAKMLDACAKEAWIYECEIKAVPIIKEDKIVYRQAAILPPPVM